MKIENDKEFKVQYYYQSIYKFVVLKLKSVENAMDVAQEVFYRYLENTKPFDSDEHEKNWLYFTASNLCNSYWRSSWYKRVLLDNSAIEFISDTTPFHEYIKKEESAILLNAVFKLPIAYRELIHLYYYENMSIKEISFITGKNESTIQTQLSRGRKKLKKKLEESGYERF